MATLRSNMSVKKAVFPIAGFGSRMLPATKAIPKEMLPVFDKPIIQYAVEEAVASGIEELIFVTGRNKQAIEDHFDIAYELADNLKKKNKTDAYRKISDFLLEPGKIKYVRQMEPLGLGHAVLCAKDLIGNEPFAVISPDDLVLREHHTPCIGQLIDSATASGGNVVAVVDVPREQTNRYGILNTPNGQDELAIVEGLVEKPNPKDAPSTLSIIGRYVLMPEIFGWLEKQVADGSGEIQLTDAMANLIGQQPFHGLRFKGTRFDCGDKLGWLEANLAFAKANQELSGDVSSLCRKYAK